MGGYEIALESKRLGPVGLGAGGSWPWLARSPGKNGRVGGAGRAGSTRDGEAFNNHGGPPSWLEGQRVLITEETPEAALAFSARLRDGSTLDALSAELLAVVDQTIQPTRASLWLRPSDERSPRTGT